MSAKQEFREVRSIRLEIMELERSRESILSTLTGHAIRYDSDKVQVSPSDMMPEVIAKVEGIDKKLTKYREKLRKKYSRCIDCIQKIEKSDYRRLLMLRYLDEQPHSWGWIAEQMGYSEDWIKHLHGDALRMADERW